MDNENIIFQGMLEKTVFANAETGFLIGKFKGEEIPCKNSLPETITALGSIVSHQVGMEYKLIGKWVENQKFGRQLKFDRHETILPQSEDGIFKYLVRVCKHVGPSIGNNLVDQYGKNTLEIMKLDPERVANEIKGITPAKAQEISESLLNNEVNERVQIELETLLNIPGMRKSLMSELISDHKSNAAEMVRKNPYFLTKYHGIGFELADRVALTNVGIARDHIERKKAAAVHVVNEYMRDGNTWIDEVSLLRGIKALIQAPIPEEGVDNLVENGVLKKVDGSFAVVNVMYDELSIAEFIIGGI